MHSPHRPRQRGFTLLEISIVVLIIALIMGSIFVGKDMIRAAQIQSAIGEYDSYQKAIKEFRDKYQAMPGDMVGAAALWGTDARGCPGTPSSSAAAQAATCDGDGGGTIGSSTTAAVLSVQAEWFRAWQHLADAGMVPGTFSGLAGSGGAAEAKPGLNVPASKLAGGWTVLYFLNTATTANYWGQQYGHILSFGGFNAGTYSSGVLLTPIETQALDAKIDDGLPATGTMQVPRYGVSNQASCTNDSASVVAQAAVSYNTSGAAGGATACAPFFILGF